MNEQIPSGGSPEEATPEIRPEKEMLPEIRNAETFDELYAALDSIGTLKGSSVYSAEELKVRIERVRKAGGGPIFVEGITTAGGLRKKVMELLEKEKKG